MARAKQQSEWSLTSNEYRVGLAVLFAALIALLTWLGNGIITGQTEIRNELEIGNSNITSLRGEIMSLRGELTRVETSSKADATRLEGLIRDADSRLTRTNDRQTDQADRLTRLETLMSVTKK